MATGFSVFVNIGGKVDKSLAGAVGQAKRQVSGLAGQLAAIGAQSTRTFATIGRNVTKTGERLQSAGTAITAGISLPMGLLPAQPARRSTNLRRPGTRCAP